MYPKQIRAHHISGFPSTIIPTQVVLQRFWLWSRGWWCRWVPAKNPAGHWIWMDMGGMQWWNRDSDYLSIYIYTYIDTYIYIYMYYKCFNHQQIMVSPSQILVWPSKIAVWSSTLNWWVYGRYSHSHHVVGGRAGHFFRVCNDTGDNLVIPNES